MLDLNNVDASKVILSDIQEKIFGIEKAMSTFFCIFDASLVILAAEILCSCIWQHLLESTKEKLSKFCHVLLTRAFTTVRHVNKTDVVTLDTTFGSFSHIIGAFYGRSNSPWLGERKSKRSCFPKLDAIKNAIADILTGLSKKPVTLSWEDNNCSTMEISGLEIGWGQVMDESSCLD
ncbi:hypothetical protein Fmac_014351 [Flemingia macrophylla]|uniref:Uncharacterized protein n=1 Tax=Flemingia macrophylla TaxID=520843 RepID=A0ABD1MC73_9FABA